MNNTEFRNELVKIMPGYKWTVHKTSNPKGFQSATGIQSSGFNRLSTLKVIRTDKNSRVWYEVKSAAHGAKSPWAYTTGNLTLARALRDLQKHYEFKANHFRALAARLETGRQPATVSGEKE